MRDLVLRDTGEVVADGLLQLDPPLAEGARDGVSGIEFTSLRDATARAEAKCKTWPGPGLSPIGSPSLTIRRPADAQTMLDALGKSVWVTQEFRWSGPPYIGLWSCDATLRSAEDGSILAEEVGHVFTAPGEALKNRSLTIPIAFDGNVEEVLADFTCQLINQG